MPFCMQYCVASTIKDKRHIQENILDLCYIHKFNSHCTGLRQNLNDSTNNGNDDLLNLKKLSTTDVNSPTSTQLSFFHVIDEQSIYSIFIKHTIIPYLTHSMYESA